MLDLILFVNRLLGMERSEVFLELFIVAVVTALFSVLLYWIIRSAVTHGNLRAYDQVQKEKAQARAAAAQAMASAPTGPVPVQPVPPLPPQA